MNDDKNIVIDEAADAGEIPAEVQKENTYLENLEGEGDG